MSSGLKKTVLLAISFVLAGFLDCKAQDTLTNHNQGKKWFVVLPLRFTHLQSSNTMLSGIKVGRQMNQKISLAISIYHSFYLKSFKSEAKLPGFKEQPRLFINGMGSEVQYNFYSGTKINVNMQMLVGWGFIKYDLKSQNFKSKQVNYLIMEPAVNLEYKINSSSSIELGLGYRPILRSKTIKYKSAISEGELPVHKSFPNGINMILCVKGYL